MSKTAEAQADSVGALLRQARELKGLTTSDVATHLRLKVSQIEQIEAEEWDPAVSATFMRGYLRAYARFLKMSEKEILQNFELQAAYLRNQAKPMHSFSKKNRLDAVDNRFMLATYLLVVLLIALFLIWFWQTHLLDSQPVSVVPEYRVSADESMTTAVTPGVLPEAAINPELTVADDIIATPAQQNTASAVPPVGTVSEAAKIASQKPAAVTSDVQAQRGPETPVASTTAVDVPPVAVTDTASAADTGAAPAAATPAASGDATANLAQLQMTFSADCWVIVLDASGKRLAYGMKSSGQSLQLTGQLPFNVTLGNAPAATVQLNQTPVDLSGYKAGQVARLTLDGQP